MDFSTQGGPKTDLLWILRDHPTLEFQSDNRNGISSKKVSFLCNIVWSWDHGPALGGPLIWQKTETHIPALAPPKWGSSTTAFFVGESTPPKILAEPQNNLHWRFYDH